MRVPHGFEKYSKSSSDDRMVALKISTSPEHMALLAEVICRGFQVMPQQLNYFMLQYKYNLHLCVPNISTVVLADE